MEVQSGQKKIKILGGMTMLHSSLSVLIQSMEVIYIAHPSSPCPQLLSPKEFRFRHLWSTRNQKLNRLSSNWKAFTNGWNRRIQEAIHDTCVWKKKKTFFYNGINGIKPSFLFQISNKLHFNWDFIYFSIPLTISFVYQQKKIVPIWFSNNSKHNDLNGRFQVPLCYAHVISGCEKKENKGSKGVLVNVVLFP